MTRLSFCTSPSVRLVVSRQTGRLTLVSTEHTLSCNTVLIVSLRTLKSSASIFGRFNRFRRLSVGYQHSRIPHKFTQKLLPPIINHFFSASHKAVDNMSGNATLVFVFSGFCLNFHVKRERVLHREMTREVVKLSDVQFITELYIYNQH